jgi:hypothetical protein
MAVVEAVGASPSEQASLEIDTSNAMSDAEASVEPVLRCLDVSS